MQLAGVYSRTPSGTEDALTFAASGWTYNNTFVLYDYETESMWYPVNDDGMECISGPHLGREIQELSGFLLKWATWKDIHPDTKIMCFGAACGKVQK